MGAALSQLARVAVIVALGVTAWSAGAEGVGASRAVGLNPVQRENALPGTQAWSIPKAPAGLIAGYASEASVAVGDLLHLHVATDPSARYRVEVFRLGWYSGTGGRLVACAPSCSRDEAGQARPVPAYAGDGYLDAGWPVTDTVTVPSSWVSGYYLADLVLTTGQAAGRGSWVPFIVREPPTQDSAILVQASVNTWQAYNRWGGMSLYMNPDGSSCFYVCSRVSFNRPYDPKSPNLWDFELPLVHFLEERGYDVSYTTDVDTDRDPAELLRHRLVIVAGHDEYWTTTMRDAFDRARAYSTNLFFAGANTGYWQMRYADDRRTILEYRRATLDPEPNPALKTVRFRSLTRPRPECQLEGVQYVEGNGEPESIGGPFALGVVPGALTDSWFAQTGFTPTSTLPNLVGYEWDSIAPGCDTPPLTALFHYGGPPQISDAVRFTAPSGARVFSAGTLNFSRGLDDFQAHPITPPTGDPRLERFMQNALVDLTRPAPPVSITAARQGGIVRIAIKRHSDPRIQAVLVYRNRTLLCARLTRSCTDHHPPRNSQPTYTAVVRDRWGTSLPISTRPTAH